MTPSVGVPTNSVPPDSAIAMHRRIEADLESHILSGEWAPGARIPSEHELTELYGCSRMTVNKALSSLAKLGLIDRRMGAGSYVAVPKAHNAQIQIRDIVAEITGKGMACRLRLLDRVVRTATKRDQTLLSVERDKVLALTTLYYADERPHAVEHRLINLNEAPSALDVDFSKQSGGGWLINHSPWANGEHHIGAVEADQETADALNIAQGKACLRIERWIWRSAEKISYAKQLFPAERHEIVARLPIGEIKAR